MSALPHWSGTLPFDALTSQSSIAGVACGRALAGDLLLGANHRSRLTLEPFAQILDRNHDGHTVRTDRCEMIRDPLAAPPRRQIPNFRTRTR